MAVPPMMNRVAKIVRKGIKRGDSRFSPEMGFNLSCIVIYLFRLQACAGTTGLYRLPAYAPLWLIFNPTITTQPSVSQTKYQLHNLLRAGVSLHFDGSVGGEPYPVWHQVGIRVRNHLSAGRRIERHVARAPLVDVGVPVAIREATGIVVKGSGPINNLGDRSADTEAGIVDAPGAFVRAQTVRPSG